MAGGKETPRQKMIGLMYLVLLALLALQVGAEIMVKFLQLNNSLHEFVGESQLKSNELISSIKQKVQERGSKPLEVKAMTAADELHKTSNEMIDFIEVKMKKAMIDKTDGYLEDNVTPAGMKNADVSSELFIGPNGTGTEVGKEFESRLDNYIANLNKIYAEIQKTLGEKPEENHYPSMTMDGKEDPNFKNSADQRNKKFLELAFDHTPMIAAMAYLTEKQSKIASYEKEILEKLKGMVGASDFKFDEIFASYKAESSVVAAGTKYKAQMFISATSSEIVPTMKWGHGAATSAIPDSKIVNGVGEIEFTASAGAYDAEGVAKKTWAGEISLKHPLTGKDTTFNLKAEYKVSKPVIQIQSASVSALYKNCGNELNVQVPALGSTYDPSFKVTGASSQKGAKKGMVTVVPNAPSVKLSVYSSGNHIGDQDFKVRLIPEPKIIAKYRGKEVDQKRGMTAPGPRSIEIDAIPDQSFKEFLPKDARYRVVEWEAILVRGKRPVNKKNFNEPEGNLSSFAAQAQPGDRILIEVKKVIRRNFLGQNEEVKLGTIIMNVPLTD